MNTGIAPAATSADDGRASHGRLYGNSNLTLVAVALGVMMVALDSTIIAVANPAIQSHLHAPLADIQWVTNGYLLALAVTLITIGKVGDRFGHKKVFVIGMNRFCLVLSGDRSVRQHGQEHLVGDRLPCRAGGVRGDADADRSGNYARNVPGGKAEQGARCMGLGGSWLHGGRPDHPAACSSSTSTGSRAFTSTSIVGALALVSTVLFVRETPSSPAAQTFDLPGIAPLVRRAVHVGLGNDQGVLLRLE